MLDAEAEGVGGEVAFLEASTSVEAVLNALRGLRPGIEVTARFACLGISRGYRALERTTLRACERVCVGEMKTLLSMGVLLKRLSQPQKK